MDRLSIGEMSRRTGCHIETIRYYERVGLLPAPPRTPGGQRAYDLSHFKRLTFVCRGRALGMTLDEIRELLRLVDSGDYTCAQVYEMTLAHLAAVRRKIADLRRLEQTFAGMAARCERGETPACPVIDILFDARSDALTDGRAASRG